MAKFLGRQAYDLIEELEPVSPRAIRERMNLQPDQMDGVLRRLYEGGFVTREGRTHKIRYSIKPGARPPVDRRGWNPNSRISLRINWRLTAASLRNLRPGNKPKGLRQAKEAWEILSVWLPTVSQVAGD